ncbi:MAG TPA: hypothetical protein DEH02_12220 [Bacteroidales bacterium]|nr:hypothetical protein [Bacteroidales bacterium]
MKNNTFTQAFYRPFRLFTLQGSFKLCRIKVRFPFLLPACKQPGRLILLLFLLLLLNPKLSSAQQEIEAVSAVNSVSILPKSDVDLSIPETKNVKSNLYALIVGNEDYTSQQSDMKSEVNVDYAEADAIIFKEYVVKTLGAPEENVTLLINATAGKMNQAISKLNKLAQVSGGKAEIIFYYAGHGLPDENSKEPYLIPVDVSGTNLQYGIKLEDLYKKLTEHPAKQITVFMDACFSGGGRNAGLVAMRSVKIKPKESPIKGNIVVFSSSSGDESSAPFHEKKHGLFTYFLLKKLQDTKGEATFKELSDFISENVKLKSVLINNKNQTPQTTGSTDVSEKWGNFKLK